MSFIVHGTLVASALNKHQIVEALSSTSVFQASVRTASDPEFNHNIVKVAVDPQGNS